MIHDPTVITARANAAAAKVRLDTSIDHAKARLSPRTLASDVVDNAADKAVEAAQTGIQIARERPAAAAAVAGTIGVLIARKPLLRLFGIGGTADDETADTTES